MQVSPFVIQTNDALGNKLFYNTLTQAFVRIETADDNGITPSTQTALANLGILTEHPDEEPRLIAEHYAIDTKTTESLDLLIAPTLDCNFACPYCYEVETRRPGLMNGATQDALVAFVERERDRRGYRELHINWYGGEPLLGIDVIEALTPRLESLGMPYTASMISNLSLATDDMVDRIIGCDIVSVLTTLDGIGTRHDAHRPRTDGAPSYERIRSAIDSLAGRGVKVNVLFNLDRTNVADYEALDEEFSGCENVILTGSQVFDYCGRFECSEDFKRPAYDLFDDPEEFANLQYARFLKTHPAPATFAELLAPTRIFCGRQLDGYLVIDEKGALYECDGDIGDSERALGTLLDDPAPTHRPYDPLSDTTCTGCALIPLCLGNCRWTRSCTGQSCIPYKWTIDQMLSDWSALLPMPSRSEADVEVLNEPISLSRFYAGPYLHAPA